jgi:3-hydroxyacyl-CoA dehydrogenase
VVEDLAVKHAVFADLDRVLKPGAILATNTWALDVNAIAEATSRPGDVVGLHFFNPANVMKLLEVVRGDATSDAVLASVTGRAASRARRRNGGVERQPVLLFGAASNRARHAADHRR